MLGPLGRSNSWTASNSSDESARPVAQHLGDGNAIRDREGEIEIRPAIAVAVGERADDSPGDDALVRRGELEHAVADAVPVVEAEQAQPAARERSAARPGRKK